MVVPFLDLRSINARFESAFHAALRDAMARGDNARGGRLPWEPPASAAWVGLRVRQLDSGALFSVPGVTRLFSASV